MSLTLNSCSAAQHKHSAAMGLTMITVRLINAAIASSTSKTGT